MSLVTGADMVIDNYGVVQSIASGESLDVEDLETRERVKYFFSFAAEKKKRRDSFFIVAFLVSLREVSALDLRISKAKVLDDCLRVTMERAAIRAGWKVRVCVNGSLAATFY